MIVAGEYARANVVPPPTLVAAGGALARCTNPVVLRLARTAQALIPRDDLSAAAEAHERGHGRTPSICPAFWLDRRMKYVRFPRLFLYGVVSSQTETALEFLLERAQAEAFIAEVEQDEPQTAALLRRAVRFG